jgi:probable rRNA maturation factor
MTVRCSAPPEALADFDLARLELRAQVVLGALGNADAELSLVLVDEPEMAELNGQHRGRDAATDVLSFSLLEGDHAEHRSGLLGDVVICLPVAARQAEQGSRSLDEELLHLLVHGILHLVGYDHEDEEEARRMQARERELREAAG